jgi:hypothetical protein
MLNPPRGIRIGAEASAIAAVVHSVERLTDPTAVPVLIAGDDAHGRERPTGSSSGRGASNATTSTTSIRLVSFSRARAVVAHVGLDEVREAPMPWASTLELFV